MHDPTPEPHPDAVADDQQPATPGGDLPALEPTGDADVDEVLGLVDDLRDRPVGEHLTTYEEAHRRLRAALDGPPGAGEASPSGPTG